MAELLSGDEPGMGATVIESPDPALAPGATLVGVGHGQVAFGIPDARRERFVQAMEDAQRGRRSITRTLDMAGHEVKILFARLLPPPRILVLGAGLDAEPLVRFADQLGWRVTVQDHRSAYIAKGRFDAAERILCEPPERVAETLALDRYEAVIVMSHHLDTDRKYLAQLAGTRIPYIGLLGPPHRRQRLLSELGAPASGLEHRLHGPAGFDIGADGPASIALSIVAEMLADMKGRA
jgi:xanthine/CO dehydrogenase XdhC/CoxF family maturation factor